MLDILPIEIIVSIDIKLFYSRLTKQIISPKHKKLFSFFSLIRLFCSVIYWCCFSSPALCPSLLLGWRLFPPLFSYHCDSAACYFYSVQKRRQFSFRSDSSVSSVSLKPEKGRQTLLRNKQGRWNVCAWLTYVVSGEKKSHPSAAKGPIFSSDTTWRPEKVIIAPAHEIPAKRYHPT